MREHSILCGGERVSVQDGQYLRLLSAMEVLQARREAETLARDGKERALCANACLLARALEKNGTPVFENGRAVMEHMTARKIGEMAGQWAELDRGENPSPEDGEERVNALKKAWSTRLMSAFAGACSKALGRCPRKNGQRK